jgi:hypothetical protein
MGVKIKRNTMRMTRSKGGFVVTYIIGDTEPKKIVFGSLVNAKDFLNKLSALHGVRYLNGANQYAWPL